MSRSGLTAHGRANAALLEFNASFWSCRPTLAAQLLWMVFTVCGFVLHAQETLPGRIKDFSMPEYFSPPNENQLRAVLRGAEAELMAGGIIVIYQLHAETFRQTGERELEIKAPVCQYDSAKRLAYSTGALEILTGDGRMAVHGRGFLWRRDEAMLIISNDVHCILKTIPIRAGAPAAVVMSGLLGIYAQTNLTAGHSAALANRPATEIFADNAEFDLRSNEARYSGNVRVENPVLKLRCELLTARLPPDAGHIESIVAERNVEFDAIDGRGKRIRGSGQKAVYAYKVTGNITNELVELTGNPVLNTDQGTLTGDVIVFDRLTGRITATNPRMTVLQPGLNDTNTLAQTNAHTSASNVAESGVGTAQSTATNTPTTQEQPDKYKPEQTP